MDSEGGVPGAEVWNDPIEFGIDWRAGINAERFWGGIEVDNRYRRGEVGEGG